MTRTSERSATAPPYSLTVHLLFKKFFSPSWPACQISDVILEQTCVSSFEGFKFLWLQTLYHCGYAIFNLSWFVSYLENLFIFKSYAVLFLSLSFSRLGMTSMWLLVMLQFWNCFINE